MTAQEPSHSLAQTLALAAHGAVAAMLDASVPAIVLGGDGRTLRLINAAAAHVLGIVNARASLGQAAPLDDAVCKHLQRVIGSSVVGRPSTERVRFYRGIKPIVLTLTLESLGDIGGEPAVLISLPELARPNADSSLQATLDLYAGPDDLITVFGHDDVIAVAGRHAVLDEAPEAIEAIAQRASPHPIAADAVTTPAGRRSILMVHLGPAALANRLFYVGPLEPAADLAVANDTQAALPVAADLPVSDLPVFDLPVSDLLVSGAARTPEPAAAADFVFVPTTRPRRFAWAIDRSGGFAEIGPGLAETLGPAAAPRLGETWAEAARRLVIDPEATIAGHLDGRQPWHAATLAWPVEGKALRVPVDLTAMPLADANGAYEGFRGFGVIRADAATDDPLATGLMLAKRRPETAASPDLIPTPESATASVDVMLQSVVATEDDDATDEPADAPLPHMMSHVAPDARAVPMTFSADNRFPRLVPPTEAASDEHFLTLMPAAHISPETLRLSGAERNAFRQIAEALGARFEGDEDLMTSSPSPASRAPEPEPVRILSTRGLLDELNRPPAELPTRTLATAGSLADAADGWQSTEGGDTRLIDRLPIAVGLTRDEAVIHVNATFLALTGYADLDDLNRAGGLDALFAGPHAAKGWAGERNRHHIPLVTKSGRVVPVDARIASVPWVGGTALLITLIAADRPGLQVLPETATAGATAAGQGDRVVELEERVRELDAVLATASDGIVMLGADGRVRSANGPAAVLFGYDPAIEPSPLIGKPLAALMAPESQRTANDYLEGLARNGIGSLLIEGRELMGCAQPDRYVPLFATIAKVTTAPEPLFAAVFRDISRWKTSEEELTLAKRRAEEASLQKSDFLAKISHEIRTPLNAIIGFSEVMLGERFGAIGVERYKDYLRDIQSSGTHIMSLVNDLLDLSKVEAGKLDLKFESVQLTELLAECVQLMQPQANRERIIIRASLMQGLPPVVADLRSIRQIVLNLLSNAIKFTPAGGQVIVSAALEETNDVVIRVRDTGYGMSAGDIEIALEPFRQVHNGRGHHTGPGSGTGLGLPLTKALVEANRAALKIDSAVNQGTLVQVTFPAPRVLAAE